MSEAGPAAPGMTGTPASAPGPGALLDRLLDQVPELSGERDIHELPGGLTNRN